MGVDIGTHHSKHNDVDFVVDDTDIGISSPVVPSTFSSFHGYQTQLQNIYIFKLLLLFPILTRILVQKKAVTTALGSWSLLQYRI